MHVDDTVFGSRRILVPDGDGDARYYYLDVVPPGLTDDDKLIDCDPFPTGYGTGNVVRSSAVAHESLSWCRGPSLRLPGHAILHFSEYLH